MIFIISVAAPPACRSYLYSHAYFAISHMHVRENYLCMQEILCMNAHQTSACNYVADNTDNPERNSNYIKQYITLVILHVKHVKEPFLKFAGLGNDTERDLDSRNTVLVCM